MVNNAWQKTTIDHLMELYIKPEIDRRRLQNPDTEINLFAAQMIFFPDGRKSIVRINFEVRAVLEVELDENTPEIKVGDQYK